MKAYKVNKFDGRKVELCEISTKMDWYLILSRIIEKNPEIIVTRQIMTVVDNDLGIDTGDLVWMFIIENCTVDFLNSMGTYPGWWLKKEE